MAVAVATEFSVPLNFGKQLLSIGGFNDLTITTKDDTVVKANAMVIAMNSPVIMAQISESGSKNVDLTDFEDSAVVSFVQCCYTGAIAVTGQYARVLFSISKTLKVDWLAKKCVEVYGKSCDSLKGVENVWVFFVDAVDALEKFKSYKLLTILKKKLTQEMRDELIHHFVTFKINDLSNVYTDACLSLSVVMAVAVATEFSVPLNFGKQLLSIGGFNDLTITTKDDTVVKANAMVIAMNSPVIMAQISESGSKNVDLTDFEDSAVVSFVQCCYTGAIAVTGQYARVLFSISKTLKVDWLAKKCVEVYGKSCDSLKGVENVWVFFVDAVDALEKFKSYKLLTILKKKLTQEMRDELIHHFVTFKINDLSNVYTDACLSLSVVRTCRELYEAIKEVSLSERGLTDNERRIFTEQNLSIFREAEEDTFDKLMDLFEACGDEQMQTVIWRVLRHKRVCRSPPPTITVPATSAPKLKITPNGAVEVTSVFMDGSDLLKCKSPVQLLELVVNDNRVQRYEQVLDALLFWEFYRGLKYDEAKQTATFQSCSESLNQEVIKLLTQALEKFGRPSGYGLKLDFSGQPFSKRCWELFNSKNEKELLVAKASKIFPLSDCIKETKISFLMKQPSEDEPCKAGEGNCFTVFTIFPSFKEPIKMSLLHYKPVQNHLHRLDADKIHFYFKLKIGDKSFALPLSWWNGDWKFFKKLSQVHHVGSSQSYYNRSAPPPPNPELYISYTEDELSQM
eukprot:sb/3462433/